MQEISISVYAPFPKDFQQDLLHVIRPHFPSHVDLTDNCVHLEFLDVMDFDCFSEVSEMLMNYLIEHGSKPKIRQLIFFQNV